MALPKHNKCVSQVQLRATFQNVNSLTFFPKLNLIFVFGCKWSGKLHRSLNTDRYVLKTSVSNVGVGV